jgi:serine/threonine-protein kinase HipA
MKTACFVYLLAATDAHSKNFSLLYNRGQSRPSMRLAPLYDIASAWPYPRRIAPQKMKLAMQIGRHYRLKEIQPRHFVELAKVCRFPADSLLGMLKELAERLPDEGSAAMEENARSGMAGEVLTQLLDGLVAQCKATSRSLQVF